MDLYNNDEMVPAAQRQGVFKITIDYLKQTRLNLLKFTSFSQQAAKVSSTGHGSDPDPSPGHLLRPEQPEPDTGGASRLPAGAKPGGGAGWQSQPAASCSPTAHKFLLHL